jgi:hypothetical protein
MTPDSERRNARREASGILQLSMSRMPSLLSLDELRRKVISELVDLEIVSARRLTRRERFVRGLRRRGARLTRLGR